jgi:tRNA (mo5U34)-methyltransferase
MSSIEGNDWLQYYFENNKKNIDFNELNNLRIENEEKLKHKNNKEFIKVLKDLPQVETSLIDFLTDSIKIGSQNDLEVSQRELIYSQAKKLIPWRKGPFQLFGIQLDAEWRSDKKWNRLAPHIPDLRNKKVLDVGCNNGYFMFKMAALNPELVLGIDPIVLNLAQFQFMNHFAKQKNLQFELWGQDDLIHFNEMFDVIFSMGVIYHHRNPIQQLLTLKNSLTPGGELILETIGIPGTESKALFPKDRYAKMRNVWFVPTASCFMNWVKRAKFKEVELLSDSELNSDEQRLTEWCPAPRQSLDDFLDPDDSLKTIEGYPAPRRFLIRAKK